jgi:hypothetical protein
MPSIRCTCGHTFGIGSFPTPNGYFLISEAAYDGLADPVDRRAIELLVLGGVQLYRCVKCGEIIIRWKKDAPLEFYARSDG